MATHVDQDRRSSYTNVSYLSNHFERRRDPFRVIEAKTWELRKIFAHIRHQVFCEEHPEFYLTKYIDHFERDEHDAHAVHFLVIYEPLHMFIGGARVILPDHSRLGFGLPSLLAQDSQFLNNFPHDLSGFCELSRFNLVKDRMKIVRDHQLQGGASLDHPDVFRHLVRAVISTCIDHNLDGFLASLEEPLFRRSKQFFGVTLKKQGAPIEFHGKRQGGFIRIEDALKEVKEIDARIYHFFLEHHKNKRMEKYLPV
ncbi:MAG: hypothetical protein C0514_04355 [Candidatus Puniceispirillum sp.]|nr:hypothetical protein [Candidatus Puniceispirillum sp.]